MFRTSRILSILVMICGLCVFADAQAMTYREYRAQIDAATRKFEDVSFRSIREIREISADGSVSTHNETVEKFSNGDSRLITRLLEVGKQEVTFQSIELGDFIYFKSDSVPWKKVCLRNCPASEVRSDRLTKLGPVDREQKVQYLVFDTELNGQPVKKYVEYRVFTQSELLNFFQEETFVDRAGRIVKKTTRLSAIFPDEVTRSSVVTYDYDPKDMKPIVAPI